MFKRPILTIFFASIVFVLTLLFGLVNNEHIQVSIFNKPIDVLYGNAYEVIVRIDPGAFDHQEGSIYVSDDVKLGKFGEWSFCQYELPDEPEFNVDLISVEMDEDINGGEVFLVDMLFENTGNTRLLAEDSNCFGLPVFNVGTQFEQDRESIFGDDKYAISGWSSASRIKMQDPYADPGETFHVTFQSIAPRGSDIYREFYQPVVENVAWVDEVFAIDIEIDDPTEQMGDDIRFVSEISIAASDLEGLERNLEITLSDQMMYARFGDTRVWSMQISSGHWETPTPRGDYEILNKQELRVGGDWPHYRMPYWQGWRWDGYGLHALPYLGNDGGAFWSEALNHIGIPVSHGCVRTLPEDAVTAYEFTSIGTPLWIH